MNYIETELLFVPGKATAATAVKNFGKKPGDPPPQNSSDLLGIKLKLGNKPLVYSLEELSRRGGKSAPCIAASGRDHYLVVHAISAVRTQGSARVDELQYSASALAPAGLQTIGLVPATRFNELLSAGVELGGALDLFGEVSLDPPSALIGQLLSETVNIAPGIQLQLSASSRFIGRFSYSLQVPVVQASGMGSGSCSWVLRPNENKMPLLGDQLLLQTIAVPLGTAAVRYCISGLVKADKGLFWKQQQISTPEYNIEVKLDPVTNSRA